MSDDFEEVVESENGAVMDFAEKYLGVEEITIARGDENGGSVLIVPKGKRIESYKKFLDEFRQFPERRTGTAGLTTLDSFIAHANRFKNEHSAIFFVANGLQASLTSVLDYHQPGADGEARWLQHKGEYQFPISKEWTAWVSHNEKPITMPAFAQFLEDRIDDVLDPSAAGATATAFADKIGIRLGSPQRLMELSRALSIRVDRKVTNSQNLATGEGQVNFEERHEDPDGSGPVKVPGGFLLAIPLFLNGPLWQVPVRLRYRISSGQVLWTYALQRTEQIWKTATDEACKEVAEKTELPLYYGSPE